MMSFDQFVSEPREGRKFIAHCYEEIERKDLWFELQNTPVDEPVTILVGPEGDFSITEVRLAMEHGYEPISLGRSRLRTLQRVSVDVGIGLKLGFIPQWLGT